MAMPLTGRCQCGALRWVSTGEPVAFYLCHCTECQRQSASVYAECLQVPADGVSFDGPSAVWTRPTGTGRVMEGRFCPTCGTRVAHRHRGGAVVVLKAGTCDGLPGSAPVAEIWTAHRRPWALPVPGALDYPGNPDMAAIRAAWADRQKGA